MRFARLKKPGWLREYITTDLSQPRQRRRLIFFVTAGFIEVILLAIGGYRLAQYMDTPEFCGDFCHTVMKPEYVAYQNSPHANVDCVACHIGPGASWLVKSKISGLRQLIAVTFNTYDRPISSPVEDLRPARGTCEKCHWPKKFSGDLVRMRRHYLEDEQNTERVDTRVFKVGGGEFEVARDIHWHIGAEVWYLPLDERRQEIGWVGIDVEDGELEQYIDPERVAEVSPERIKDEKRLMDCIDCHNRATHIFYSPEDLIDKALAQGGIDRSLPFIKREGLKALDPVNPSLDQAMGKVESIDEFYRTSYPQTYAESGEAIDEAIGELKEIARLTTFPDMKVSWETHPDNIGHLEWPGCFRCHGKLVATTGDREGEVIDASCNSCHYPLAAQ